MTIKYIYVGEGAFLQGVPARDLTNDDWARLTDVQKQTVKDGALYELVEVARSGDRPQQTEQKAGE